MLVAGTSLFIYLYWWKLSALGNIAFLKGMWSGCWRSVVASLNNNLWHYWLSEGLAPISLLGLTPVIISQLQQQK